MANGNYNLFEFLTDQGTDIQMKTKKGQNCLHIAAENEHLNLCKTLIEEHNFDVQETDSYRITALHLSCRSASYKLVKFFANKGTDIKLKTNDGQNCLHTAADNAHLNLCKTLIEEHNFDVQETDCDGWKALHWSCRSGSYELVTFFANKGTDIQLKTHSGQNCLHIAAEYGHLNLCKTLIAEHNFDVKETDNYGWTALHWSCGSGSYELVTFFANKGTDIQLKAQGEQNCLHIAAEKEHLNLCKTLIEEENFDVQVTDKYVWKALHWSCGSGSYELFKFLTEKETDIQLKTEDGQNCLYIAAGKTYLNLCKTLIEEHNFDVQETDSYRITALHLSCRSASYKLVKFFANKGTDIKLKTNDGQNCLHTAADNAHLSLCKTLIEEHNFDVLEIDNDGWTALHKSAEKGNYELFQFLTDKGTDIQLKTKDGQNCLHIATANGHLNLCKTLIEEHNFDVQETDNDGWTALHESGGKGNNKLFKFLTKKGTDIQLKTKDGKNCLHIAAENGHLNLCKTLVEEHNFDVQLADSYGWTALHRSAKKGRYELLQFLTDKGTDIQLKTKDGQNCLHIAADYGHLNLCKTLVEEHKFDVQESDSYGITALHLSCGSGSYELVRFFANKRTDIELKAKEEQNCLHIAAYKGDLNLCKTLIEEHNFDVQKTDSGGWTALHCSCGGGSYELVTFFANRGTDIKLKTKDGGNCFHLAADERHLNLWKRLIEEHNFDLKETDRNGWATLHYSSKIGSYELIKFFVNKGTDIQLKTKDG